MESITGALKYYANSELHCTIATFALYGVLVLVTSQNHRVITSTCLLLNFSLYISFVQASEDPHSVQSTTSWIEHSFIKPLRCLAEISSYPHLTHVYKILATLAVTSTSAERVLSRVRIVKNRLRTSMADDWFAALTILAAEGEILQTIPTDDILDAFAHCSVRLREHLM